MEGRMEEHEQGLLAHFGGLSEGRSQNVKMSRLGFSWGVWKSSIR
jgi:hypothetical protein